MTKTKTINQTMTNFKQKNINDLSNQDWLNILHQCANNADETALHYFSQSTVNVIQKADNSPVTLADRTIETNIRQYFAANFPDVGIIGEEYELTNTAADIKLIIDPIDATSNFICGIPIFACLLAIEKNKQIIAAVVSNGATKERWAAALNNGATYNNTPIAVSKIDTIANAQAFYGSLFGREARGNQQQLLNLLSFTKRQRGIGDFLMHMWVASGYGEFAIDFGLQPWDLAPLGLIVTEAGGTITAVNGDPFDIYEGSILTSNGLFHSDLITKYNS